jgi:hypothetical protein
MQSPQSINWSETIGKEARGRKDDGDFGEVQAVENDHVLTKRGIIEKDEFYLPKSRVYGFDGHTLWLEVSEKESDQFKRQQFPPPSSSSSSSSTS